MARKPGKRPKVFEYAHANRSSINPQEAAYLFQKLSHGAQLWGSILCRRLPTIRPHAGAFTGHEHGTLNNMKGSMQCWKPMLGGFDGSLPLLDDRAPGYSARIGPFKSSEVA